MSSHFTVTSKLYSMLELQETANSAQQLSGFCTQLLWLRHVNNVIIVCFIFCFLSIVYYLSFYGQLLRYFLNWCREYQDSHVLFQLCLTIIQSLLYPLKKIFWLEIIISLRIHQWSPSEPPPFTMVFNSFHQNKTHYLKDL